MPIPFLAAAGAQVIGGVIGAISSGMQARQSQRRANELDQQLRDALSQRPEVPDLAQNIQDRSSMIQNQFSNLQVATQAAQFQAEEADVSLANTLDTLRATGTGAGGATALAQAALRSKRDIGASIEQQEARNAELRARGAESAQTARLAEGARVDQAKYASDQFAFGVKENRSQQKIDRVSNMLDAQNARTAQAKSAMWGSIGSALGAAGGTAFGAWANKGDGTLIDGFKELGKQETTG